MKIFLSLPVVFALVASSAFAQDEEKAWFDMQGCKICENMLEIEGMMERVSWESHKIPNGLMTVTVVPEDMEEVWAETMAGMEATIEQVRQGEAVETCGFCTSFGKIMANGAVKTEIDTAGGRVMLLTSDDEEVVANIHTHVDKTHEAMMAMMPERMESKDGDDADDDSDDDDHDHDDDGDEAHDDHDHDDDDDHEHGHDDE